MIRLSHISKTYLLGRNPLHILRHVSLEIADGEFVAIMGPSGSGKTTLMNIIGLLDVADSGDLEINGTHMTSSLKSTFPQYRREYIGFVFQNFNLIPRLSVEQNVLLPAIYARQSRSARTRSAKRLLEDVGLSDRCSHRPNELSGGERQRVAIARALINDPSIVLADEPTGNLDTKTGEAIVSVLRAFHKRGKTIVLVTHDQEVAAAAERIITIRDGRIAT